MGYTSLGRCVVETKDGSRIVGIGVAIGSIGTFFAAVFAKFVDLPSCQLPVILVGLMLVISLPSMLIAALSRVAVLPPNARRSLEDPYEDKAANRRASPQTRRMA